MIFSNKITQLRFNNLDNKQKNDQAHVDLENLLLEIDTMISLNHDGDGFYSKKSDWENLDGINGLKLKHNILTSNLKEIDENTNDYTNHIYFLKCGTIINGNLYPYYVLEPSLSYWYYPSSIYNPNGQHYYTGYSDDRNQNSLWSFEYSRTSSAMYSTNSVESHRISNLSSGNQSFILNFSFHGMDIDDEMIFNNCFFGFGILNQPILEMSVDELNLLKEQTDGLSCFLQFDIDDQTTSTDNVLPRINGKFSPSNMKINFGRVQRKNSMILNGLEEYAFHYEDLDQKIEWDINTDIMCTKTDGFEPLVQIDLDNENDINHYYQGSQINELKLEYKDRNDYFICMFYFNGKVIGKFYVENQFLNYGDDIKWFNKNHLFPFIICKVPSGMVKIHSYEFKML